MKTGHSYVTSAGQSIQIVTHLWSTIIGIIGVQRFSAICAHDPSLKNTY